MEEEGGGTNNNVSDHTDSISNSNSNNLKISNRTQGPEHESQINFSFTYGDVDTSPGIGKLGSTCFSHHLDHVATTPTQPLSCSIAASNSGTGVGGGGEGGILNHYLI